MQCEHIIEGIANRQCKHSAVGGFNLCRQHGWITKYYILFAWQEQAGDHWTKRKKAVWPILFFSREAAWTHLHAIKRPFQNMQPRRKLSCSVERTKKTFPQTHLRSV